MSTALDDLTARRRFYQKWSRTDEGRKVRAPAEYHFLLINPSNFRLVREKFHVAWITHKMTEL